MAKQADASDLENHCPETYRGKNKLSALSEKREVEYRKFREGLTANPEPSPTREGAETRHGTPKS